MCTLTQEDEAGSEKKGCEWASSAVLDPGDCELRDNVSAETENLPAEKLKQNFGLLL